MTNLDEFSLGNERFFYCSQCLTTSLRPNAQIDDGVCQPCTYSLGEENSDFRKQKIRLEKIVKDILSEPRFNSREYDCIIGVSGGKDSTRQAIWVRDVLKLKVLLVCCSYPPEQMIETGANNLANIIQLGFDLEVVNPAPLSAQKLSLQSFLKFGNVCKASEIALWTSVPQLALEKNIPICFYGENPALQEGDSAALGAHEFDANETRNLNTLTAGGINWIRETIGDRKFQAYNYPTAKAFEDNGLQMLYLGPAWCDWDMEENALYSVLEGLITRPNETHITGDLTNASMLDEEFTNINMMIKYYKFGFGRATDLCNELIRQGRMSREDAMEKVKKFDGICSDETIDRYCQWVGITAELFWEVVWSYTNPDIFLEGHPRPIANFEVGIPLWG